VDKGLLPSVSIWAIFIGTLVVSAISVEAGYQWAKRKKKREVQEHEGPGDQPEMDAGGGEGGPFHLTVRAAV